MDSKDSGHSVSESDHTTFGEELVHRELESDAQHHCVSRVDIDFASLLLVVFDVELQAIDNTLIAPFTTVSASWLSPGALSRAPIGRRDYIPVTIVQLICTSRVVPDCHHEAWRAYAAHKFEFLLLWWRSRELNVVVDLLPDKRWESALTLLASVETIPAVIHVRVKTIVEP